MNLKTTATPAEPRDLKSPIPGQQNFAAGFNRRCRFQPSLPVLTVAANPVLAGDLNPSLRTMTAI